MKRTETHWALAGRWNSGRLYFYYGTFATRKAAIADAVQNSGKSWKELRARGERAVKVTISGDIPVERETPE